MIPFRIILYLKPARAAAIMSVRVERSGHALILFRSLFGTCRVKFLLEFGFGGVPVAVVGDIESLVSGLGGGADSSFPCLCPLFDAQSA
jgi:hypothetical protein